MELNVVGKHKFGYVQQNVKLTEGQQAIQILQRQCHDAVLFIISPQTIFSPEECSVTQ